MPTNQPPAGPSSSSRASFAAGPPDRHGAISIDKRLVIEDAAEIASLRKMPGLDPTAAAPFRRVEMERAGGGLHLVREIIGPDYAASKKPFALRFGLASSHGADPRVLVVDYTFPSGRQFSESYEIEGADIKSGYLDVGPIVSGTFGHVQLTARAYTEDGRATAVDHDVLVVPSNPIQLNVTAEAVFPTSWRGPARWRGPDNAFLTSGAFRIYNGTAQTQTFGSTVRMQMWDRGVGGTLVEEWTFELGGISVPPWTESGVVTFTNTHPNGSGTHGWFSGGEDLTLRVEMRTAGGEAVAGTAVWATMSSVGINVIYVGDFNEFERDEIYRAAKDCASSIYEQWNLHVVEVLEWWLFGGDVDRYRDMDYGAREYEGLWSGWSVPNRYIDVFMNETFSNGGGWGFSFVNCPVDKNGSRSGVCIHKDPDVLNMGQTFAHEIGHHLGLEHADENDGLDDTDPADPNLWRNFIFSSSARDSAVITYKQWDRMTQHGFVSRGVPISDVRRVAGWFGWENQGSAIDIGPIGGDGQADMVVMHVDNPTYGNTAFYRIGWDVDGSGNPDSWSAPKPVPGWFGWENQAGGVALGDVSRNGRPDLLIFHIDNPGGQNRGYYRIGWNLNDSGDAASWSDIKAVPGNLGAENQGGGIAVGDINGNGRLDLVVFWIENLSGDNRAYYRIGWDLDDSGDPSSWSDIKAIPGWFGWENQGGDIALADVNGNGRLDLVVMHIDNPGGDNRAYYRIGWNLDNAGNAASWTEPRAVPGWFGWESHGGGVALSRIGANAGPDLFVFHIDNPSGENQGYYRIGWDLDAAGWPRFWR